GAGGLEVWSTAEGRIATHFGDEAGAAPRALAFAAGDRLVSTVTGGSQSVIQVWDGPSGQLLKTCEGAVGMAWATSPNGKFLATVAPGKLSVYDLDAGKLAGESEVPATVTMAKCMSFS